ncbi:MULTISPECIES: hypothetical protein [Lysobacter]|uniref:hypothetical protein n=1 Tax=Lysobacter TaxID=68 RepID=UPI001F3A2B08|nr:MULTISPECIES: hypothetical protein [Lysobacter]UJB18405.1 hypothetical protein L1A79_19025 [Lysobacter capsici]UJQ27871.1 hypothetical protein L2D09_20860 [Lysobacter gummosus]
MIRSSRTASASRRLAWLGLAAALAAPFAQAADQCQFALGRGWPPATENHGSAVEQLLAAKAEARLTLTYLPTRGTESGLLLIPGSGDADWTLRHAMPNERVAVWNTGRASGALQLRVEQEVDNEEAPIPAALAQRLVAGWKRALESMAPKDKPAEYQDKDQLLFVVDGLRVSGVRPDCGAGEIIMKQAGLLTEASNESASKRERRWRALGESLDELDKELTDTAAPAR